MASQTARGLNKLFVKNLPWTVGHRELLEYFASFGSVKHARVVFDKSSGLSRGYGFVTFASKNGFDNALNKGTHKLEGAMVMVASTS